VRIEESKPRCACLGILWDICLHHDARGKNIGIQVFNHCTNWARGCQGSQLKIETQNVNVTACCLYTKQGCPLVQIDQHAYQNSADVAGEITLVWYYDLKSAYPSPLRRGRGAKPKEL